MPSRAILVFFKSTEDTLAFFFLKAPRIISTSSPFLRGRFLLLYLILNSFDKLALKNLCFICRGAFAINFLCFLGCELAIHDVENLLFMLQYKLRYFRNLPPSLLNFSCHWTLYLGPFWIS